MTNEDEARDARASRGATANSSARERAVADACDVLFRDDDGDGDGDDDGDERHGIDERYRASLWLLRASEVKTGTMRVDVGRAARARASKLARALSRRDALKDDECSRGILRETMMIVIAIVARVESDVVAAEELAASESSAECGAALARWIALRLVDRHRRRELGSNELMRFAAIVGKAGSKPESRGVAMAFCDFGGASALCASIRVAEEEEEEDECDDDDGRCRRNTGGLSAGAMVDCAKAISSVCAWCPAHIDRAGVRAEIRSILESSTGKMSDPVPAVASSLLRQALAALEKYESRGGEQAANAPIGTVVAKKPSLTQFGYLGDCVEASTPSAEADDVSSKAFGSQIELSRASSASSIYQSMMSSPSVPVTAALKSPAPATLASPPPLTRTRSRSSGGILTPIRSRLSMPVKRTSRQVIRRFAFVLAVACAAFVMRAVFLAVRGGVSLSRDRLWPKPEAS